MPQKKSGILSVFYLLPLRQTFRHRPTRPLGLFVHYLHELKKGETNKKLVDEIFFQ